MPIFGRAWRMDRPPLKVEEPPKQGGTEQVRQVSGFMAPWSRKNLPRSLQVVGAGLQQIGDNRGQLSEFSANEAEQARYDAAMAVRQRGSKQEDQQQAMIDRAISELPPEQQRLARLDPEGFMRALMERQNDPNHGWQVGQGYSRAFRIRPDGTREDGAELPLRPRAPIQGYVMPNDLSEWDYEND